MRKYLLVTLALAGLIVVSVAGVATAGSKEKVVVENVEFRAGGAFKPKKLKKNRQTPIKLIAEGKIRTTDGSHPPALRKVILETDKNGAVNVKGYPVCKKRQIQSTDTQAALRACKKALIGTGKTTVEIAFVEQNPVLVHSRLLVFNGGVRGGTTTFYIHAYITVPTPAAIVTTVKIKKHRHGRYGLKSIATIPKIAGGAGSVTSFRLKIDKKFTYKHHRKSILTAKCPDGRLQAHATAYFANGLRAATEFVRPCIGKR